MHAVHCQHITRFQLARIQLRQALRLGHQRQIPVTPFPKLTRITVHFHVRNAIMRLADQRRARRLQIFLSVVRPQRIHIGFWLMEEQPGKREYQGEELHGAWTPVLKFGLSPDRLALPTTPDLGRVQSVRRNRVRYAENRAYGTGVQFGTLVGLRMGLSTRTKTKPLTAYL
jgi:hypothetical protein